MVESGGPDEKNMGCNCGKHHAGSRTGIKDYCCCCNPCQYITVGDAALRPEEELCCRCVPKMIVFKFTPDNPEADCCRMQLLPVLVDVWFDDNQRITPRWQATFINHPIAVYMSNDLVNDGSGYEESDYLGCRWTIRAPTLGVDETVEIDHVTVTCLGVPAISISNVTGFGNCVGTITIQNFETAKLPFVKREFPWNGDPDDELTVPIPDGFICDPCEKLPRHLCISGAIHASGGHDWYEFNYDDDFIPIVGTYGEPDIIARWIHNPNPTTLMQVYLIKDEGVCYLQPDFESPVPSIDPAAEKYERIELTMCACDVKILAHKWKGYSINNTSTINIVTGRCGCWQYFCAKCRCVPRYLCGFAFVNGTFYSNIRFEWDDETKCWISSGGADISGYGLSETFNLCLGNNAYNQCVISLTRGSETMTAGYDACENSIMNASFSSNDSVTGDNFMLHVGTSFDSVCESLLKCTAATKCADFCGSHPASLTLTMHAWSDPYLDEPGFDEECLVEVDLFYWEQVYWTGVSLEIFCGYVGFFSKECPAPGGGTEWRHFIVEYQRKQLDVYEMPANGWGGPSLGGLGGFTFSTEECDPYEATFPEFSYGGPHTQIWCCSQTVQRLEMTIIE